MTDYELAAITKLVNFGCISFTIVGFFATIYQARLRIAAENSLDLSYRQKLTGIYLAMFIVFGILSVATA